MTDYVGAQQSISFDYDATLEVVTKDRQKLQLASSGTVSLARPDKIRTTRSGGFVDMETVFDGKTLTLFGKNKNVYTQVEVPGSLDNLMNELHKKYDRPLPAADLFFTRAHDEITADVTDVKAHFTSSASTPARIIGPGFCSSRSSPGSENALVFFCSRFSQPIASVGSCVGQDSHGRTAAGLR